MVLLGGCYGVARWLLRCCSVVAMVLVGGCLLLLGGCYGVGRWLLVVAMWLLGAARWLLWCC